MDPPAKQVKSFKFDISDDHHSLFNPLQCNKPNTPNLDFSFSSYLRPPPPSQKSAENDDLEISIFDAQKYFSENGNSKEVKTPQIETPSNDFTRLSSVSSVDSRNYRLRSTPTASSEASWNSQTGLLVNPPGSTGVSIRSLSDRKKQSMGWIFGRKCCCTGEKSVRIKRVTSNSDSTGETDTNCRSSTSNSYATREINHNMHHHKVPVFPAVEISRQQRVTATGPPFAEVISGGFSFPILDKPIPANKSQQLRKPTVNIALNPSEDFPPRESIEVFQPWRSSLDAAGNPRRHFNIGSPIKRVSNADDDNVSDASSDLFEIESISTQTGSFHMYRKRDSDETPRKFSGAGRSSIDDPSTPSVAATECYPPSEVSVDWSVNTAEGLASISNFSVSASQIGVGESFFRRRLEEEKAEAEAAAAVDKKRVNNNGGLLLMGCRHEKAVSIASQPVKFVSGESSSSFPVRIPGRPPRSEKSPPAHSARLSLAFAA